MKVLFLLCLLVSWAWARPAAEVVREAFDYDRQFGMKKTLTERGNCFTPGFRDIFLRALALPPGGKAFVDMDYFYCTQDGGMQFRVDRTEPKGEEVWVFVKTWQGAYRGAPSQPVPAQPRTRVHLVDVGSGPQIKDIVHLPQGTARGLSVRKDLELLLQGNWPE